MFLSFANFYKRFLKSFSRIAAPLILILKMIVSSVLVRLVCIRTNKNEFSTDSNGSIDNGRIDDRMANLSNFTKKISFEAGFFTPKVSLTFT